MFQRISKPPDQVQSEGNLGLAPEESWQLLLAEVQEMGCKVTGEDSGSGCLEVLITHH